MSLKEKFVVAIAIFFPFLAIADTTLQSPTGQVPTGPLPPGLSDPSFKGVANFALRIIGNVMATIFALFGLGLIYLVFKYISALRQGSKDADTYKNLLIAAIVGMAVLFSLWGIVSLISNTMGFGFGIPQFQAGH